VVLLTHPEVTFLLSVRLSPPVLPDLDEWGRGSRAIAILLVQYHWGKVGGQKCICMGNGGKGLGLR